MEIFHKNEGRRTAKVLVESNSQICLNALDELAGRLWREDIVTSSSRVNHNGGYSMYFRDHGVLRLNLCFIAEIVEQKDETAQITVFNSPPDNQ